jgi:hypothetical protein
MSPHRHRSDYPYDCPDTCGLLVEMAGDRYGDRAVNALTSHRLTDRGNGSTFHDNVVDVRPAT